MKNHDTLVVGNYSHDILILEDREKRTLGGPPAYIASVLVPFGVDFDIVSKVGRDFLYMKYLKELGIEIKPVVSAKPTTTMLHDYSQGKRKSKLLALCEPIRPEDIRTSQAISIVASHTGEVLPETVEKMRKTSGIVVADAQGFIRKFGKNSAVHYAKIQETQFYGVLGEIDFLKASIEEVKFIRGAEKKTNIIITSENGCIIYGDGKKFQFPIKRAGVVDSTGAGDVFIGGFSYGLSKGYGIQRCAEIANHCAAIAIAQVGVPRLSRSDVKKFL